MEQFMLQTPPEGFIDITRKVAEIVHRSQIRRGICQVFIPHTTAGVTVNEQADPDVAADMERAYAKLIPWSAGYAHAEGNSAAHIQTSLAGTSALVPVRRGRLALGTWQGIFLCEFDGPRTRELWLTPVKEA